MWVEESAEGITSAVRTVGEELLCCEWQTSWLPLCETSLYFKFLFNTLLDVSVAYDLSLIHI